MSIPLKVKITVVKSEHLSHGTVMRGILPNGLPKVGEGLWLYVHEAENIIRTFQTSEVKRIDAPVFYTENSIYLVEPIKERNQKDNEDYKASLDSYLKAQEKLQVDRQKRNKDVKNTYRLT